MSRHGYVDDGDDDNLAMGRWRAQVASSIRGKRGQAFLRDMAAALDAMLVKELIAEELVTEEGDCCAIGAVCLARGIDTSKIDYEEYGQVAAAVDIATPLAREIEYENDADYAKFEMKPDADKLPHWSRNRYIRIAETPAERWQRMRKWVERHIAKTTAPTQ